MITVKKIELEDDKTGEIITLNLDPATDTNVINNLRDMLEPKHITLRVEKYEYVKSKEVKAESKVKKITKKDVIQLRKDFNKYTKTAEQYEFIWLYILDKSFSQTEDKIANDDKYIEKNQRDLRTMFRIILKTIHKDYSEYKELDND